MAFKPVPKRIKQKAGQFNSGAADIMKMFGGASKAKKSTGKLPGKGTVPKSKRFKSGR